MRLDGLQVEAGPGGQVAGDAEDHHAAHEVGGAVGPGPAVLPLGPDGVPVDHASEYLGVQVGDGGEDVHPVTPDLVTTGESPFRMGWGLVPVVRGEAGHQGFEIMVVGGPPEAFHHGHLAVVVGGVHGQPPFSFW